MTAATLARPVLMPVPRVLPPCVRDPDRWHDPATEREARHECLRHCPTAVREECALRAAVTPPSDRCVQAGLVWVRRPNRAGGRRVPDGGTVPSGRQPQEDLCPDCVARAIRERLCQSCLGPMPVDIAPSAKTCGLRCSERHSRALARARQAMARQADTTDPAGTVPAAQ